MVWIALTGAVILLGLFLVNVVRSYERESARTALDRVDELSRTVESLEIRIRNLETIATDGPNDTRSHSDMDGATGYSKGASVHSHTEKQRTPTRL